MNPKSLPFLCGLALAAMTAGATSHWWSVRQFVAAIQHGVPMAAPVAAPEIPTPKPTPPRAGVTREELASRAPSRATAAEPARDEFYDTLITRMESLQNQNRDLLDQVAETNRDLMKLEFRVDTHSESFRPLQVSDDRIDDTTIEDGPGVLPPRAEPVFLPTYE